MDKLFHVTQTLIALTICLPFLPSVFGTEQTFPCNVSVPCDCCLDEHCINGTNICSSTNCKEGYWSFSCDRPCPDTCVSCDIDFQVNEICYNCKPGYYDTVCSINCSIGCRSDSCDKNTGYCNECVAGYYGSECRNNCPAGCKEDICDKDTGECIECEPGFYDVNCSSNCPEGCKDEICDKNNGSCNDCVPGHYGTNCISKCPEGCKNDICDKETGYCKECVPGQYDTNCSSDCSLGCRDGTCDRYTGECSDCVPGFYDTNCHKNCSEGCKEGICDKKSGHCIECVPGYYGKAACNMSCSSECTNTTCDINTGTCILGCNDGMYGYYCNNSCPSNCTETCNQSNGHCISCKPGFYGTHCNESCPVHCYLGICYINSGSCYLCVEGFYGSKCTLRCPHTCNDNVCERYTGLCTKGCVPGKYGNECNKNCSLNCFNGECSLENGECRNGCEDGYSDSKYCCANTSNCDTCSSYSECTKCVDYTYGLFCGKNCSNNCHGPCDKSTGYCFNCHVNHYGPTCENNCSSNCLPFSASTSTTCYGNNGSCILGCQSGYFGEQCESKCSSDCNASCARSEGECESCAGNMFGKFCEQTCPDHCRTSDNQKQFCVRENGTCKFGCKAMFYGNKCEKSCQIFCDGSCHLETGQCDGCIDDRFGLTCEDKCSERCAKGRLDTSKCHQQNGTCMFGCSDGYTGYACALERTTDEIPIVAVIVPIFSLVVIGVVAGVIITTTMRKRKKNQKERDDTDTHTGDPSQRRKPLNKDTGFQMNERPSEVEFNSNSERHTTLEIKQLRRDILSKKIADYLEEFKNIQNQAVKKSFEEAKKPANKKKNNYPDIYPYDDTRVKIVGTDSDYINASYINGYGQKHAYIASQGPMVDSIGQDFASFWQMVWQQKVETIVMLTGLIEGGECKCNKYWPDIDVKLKCGEFEVNCDKEETFAEFVVRRFTISKKKIFNKYWAVVSNTRNKGTLLI